MHQFFLIEYETLLDFLWGSLNIWLNQEFPDVFALGRGGFENLRFSVHFV